jgi:hypothetical protein
MCSALLAGAPSQQSAVSACLLAEVFYSMIHGQGCIFWMPILLSMSGIIVWRRSKLVQAVN